MIPEAIRGYSQKEVLSQQSMLGSQPCIIVDSIHRGKKTSTRTSLRSDIAFPTPIQLHPTQGSITLPSSISGNSGSWMPTKRTLSCPTRNYHRAFNNRISSRRYLYSSSRRTSSLSEARPLSGLTVSQKRELVAELREKALVRSSVAVIWATYSKIVKSGALPQLQSDDTVALFNVLAQSHQSEEAMEIMLQVALDVNEIGKQLPQESFEILLKQAIDHLPTDQIKAAVWQIQGRRRFISELVQLCDSNMEMREVLGLYSQLVKSSFDVDGYSAYFQERTNQARKLGKELLKWIEAGGVNRNHQVTEYLLVFLLDRSRHHQVFSAIESLSKEGHIFSHGFFTTAIHRFGRAQKFDYMQSLVDLMRKQGHELQIDTYSAIIDVHSKAGNLQEAQRVYQEILTAGLVPTNKTLGPMLEAVGATGDYSITKQLVEQLNSSGVASNEYTFSALLQSTALNPAKTAQIFNELSQKMEPNIVNYNILIRAFQYHGDLDGAFRVFQSMVAKGIRPDKYTFSSILSLFAQRGDTDGAEAFWNEMVSVHGVKPNAFAYGSMMHVYCTAEDMVSAQTVYREMIQASIWPNEVIFGTLLNAYARHGDLTQMLSIYDTMRSEGLKPNSYIYANLLFGLVKDGDMPAAQRLYDTMAEDGYGHNVLAQTILMKGYLDNDGFKESQTIYKNMIHSGLVPNFMTYAALLQAHVKRGETREARDFLNKILKSRGLVVTGDEEVPLENEELKRLGINKNHDRANASSPDSFDRESLPGEALDDQLSNMGTERKLLKKSARPNPLMTFTPLLDAYAKEGNFMATKAMFDEIKARGLEPNTITFTILMDSYRRAGDVDNVLRIWDELFNRFLDKWKDIQHRSDRFKPSSAMSVEWVNDRLSTKASKLRGILQQPVSVVLDALCYSGKILEAKTIWKKLEAIDFEFDSSNWNDYCIALARNGYLMEALEIVQDKLLPGYIASLSGHTNGISKNTSRSALQNKSMGSATTISRPSAHERNNLELTSAAKATMPRLPSTLFYPRPRLFAALADSLEDLLSLKNIRIQQLSGLSSKRDSTISLHSDARIKLVEAKLQPYPQPFQNLREHDRQILWDRIQKEYPRVLEVLAEGMLVVSGPLATMRAGTTSSNNANSSKAAIDPESKATSVTSYSKPIRYRPWRNLKIVMKDMERQKFIQEREDLYEQLRMRKSAN
ncbi:hypothetical protein FBU30_004612 [Linnemannia zychae]|nr:hypothetical protein FBU30_004612 [Linnemannia zychae]